MKSASAMSPTTLIIIGCLIGAYLFFHPIHPIAAYLTQPDRVFLADNYWAFSDSIFRPQNVFWAESILMPLLAKALGASADRLAFLFLNVVFTISIMPVFCLALSKRVQSLTGLFLGIVIFATSFRYLHDYVLGAPDPLTIIFILLAASAGGRALAFYIFMAGITHFSLALVAVIAMIPLQALVESDQKLRRRDIKNAIAGLLLSKLFLLGWYWTFNYEIFSRWDFIKEKGIGHFSTLFIEKPVPFFYTPGPVFGLISFFGMIHFLIKRQYSIPIAYGFALTVAYGALFITLDGLRIFSVAIVGAYFYFLVCWLNRFVVLDRY